MTVNSHDEADKPGNGEEAQTVGRRRAGQARGANLNTSPCLRDQECVARFNRTSVNTQRLSDTQLLGTATIHLSGIVFLASVRCQRRKEKKTTESKIKIRAVL